MIDFDYRPTSYFDGTGPTSLIVKLTYPESQWGEELCLYAAPVDKEIFYEVIDFYGNDYRINPEKSDLPLSLQEMIVLIETLEVSEKDAQGKINTVLSGIPEAESWVYPQLKEYFMTKRKNFGMI